MKQPLTSVRWLDESRGIVDFGTDSEDVEGGSGAAQMGILPAREHEAEAANANSELKRRVKRLEEQMRKVLREIRRLKRASQSNEIEQHILSYDVLMDQGNSTWVDLPGMSATITPRGKATLHITGQIRVEWSVALKYQEDRVAVRVLVNGTELAGRGVVGLVGNHVALPGRLDYGYLTIPFAGVVDVNPRTSYSIRVQATTLGLFDSNYITVATGDGSTDYGSHVVIETHARRKRQSTTTLYKTKTFLLSANYDAYNDRIVVLRARAQWRDPFTNYFTSGGDKFRYELAYYTVTDLPVVDFDASPGTLIYKWVPDDPQIPFNTVLGRLCVRSTDGMIFAETLDYTNLKRTRKLVDPAGFEEAETVETLTFDDYGNTDGLYSEGLPLFYNGSIYTGGLWENDSNGTKKFTMDRLSDTDLSATASAEIAQETGENNVREVLGWAVVSGLIRVWFVTDHSGVSHFRYSDYNPATDTFGSSTENLTSETDHGIGWPNSAQIVPFNSLYALAIFRSATVFDVYEYTGGEATFGTLLVDDAAKDSGERMGIIATTTKLIFVQGNYLGSSQNKLEEIYAL